MRYNYSISTIAMIVFFGLYGVSHFIAIPSVGLVLAIAAIVAAVALVMGK